MPSRFAEHHLHIRSKLKGLLHRVEVLAEESHIKVEGLTEMGNELSSPLRVLVLGDSDTGQDGFLDTLIGNDVSKHLKGKRWKLADFSAADYHEAEPLYVEKIKHPEVEDLLIIKSPPLQKLEEQDQQQVADWLEHVDVVFWMFSAENPWSNTTWGEMEKVSQEVLDRSVVVLTHTDNYSVDDQKVMIGHMRSLSEQRLVSGTVVNIHPVTSAKGTHAGFSDVWERANAIIESSQSRLHYLSQVKDKVRRVLDLIETGLDERASNLDEDKGFLASLEADLDRQREREIQLYAGRGVHLTDVFVEHLEPTLKMLDRRCGLISTTADLFGRGIVASKVEKYLIDRVCDSLVNRGESDCQKILLDCKEQWRGMQSHLDERLGADVGEFQQEAFKETLPEIKKQLEKAAKIAVLSMKLRHTMEVLLEPRRQRLKYCLSAVLIGCIISGILGAFVVSPTSWIALGALALSGVGGLYYVYSLYSSRQKVFHAVADRVVDLKVDFSENVIETYQDMVREFFTGYTPMFQQMRSTIAEARINLEPLQKRHHTLFLELVSIGNDID